MDVDRDDAAEQPYSPAVYHTVVNSVVAAYKSFDDRGLAPIVYTSIRDCFLRHGVEDNFSACLIHRHYNLADNERNVEENGHAYATTDLDGLHSSSWMYFEGRLYPYEFKRQPVPSPPHAFVRELRDILESNRITDIVGFQVYDNDDTIGFETTDRNNISTTVSVPVTDKEEMGRRLPGTLAASWAFFRGE